MNKDFLFGASVGLAIGLLIALFSFQIGRGGGLWRDEGPIVAAPARPPANPPPMPQDLQGAGPNQGELMARITTATQLVQSNPKDRQAWVTLGNSYFDLRQPEKSIEAYDHALKLDPDDPDVLTDQGVMYRELHQYEKALANFQRANALRPNHVQSLFNIAVVYGDLHDKARAIAAYQKVVDVAPQSDDAARARERIAELQAQR